MRLTRKLISTITISLALAAGIPSCSIFHPNGYTFHVHFDEYPQMTGRSQFIVHLQDKVTAEDVPGVQLMVEPVMQDMNHSTPVEKVVDNGDGSYTATVYYIMPGDWVLNIYADGVKIGQEPTYTVGGSMMSRGLLKGITGNDEVYGANRKYYIFKKSISAGTAGNDSIDIFLASSENMMEYPAVYSGQRLVNDDGVKTAGAWTVGTIILSVCSNWSGSSCTAWSDLTEDMSHRGHFTGTGLTIANTGSSMMPAFAVHLHESTTKEWKTTDGNAGDGNGNGPTEFQSINQ